MKWRACAGALLVLLSPLSKATGLSDAFSSGQALGNAGVASAQGAITAGQGTSVVPNYTGAAPESSYFAGGQGSLFAPATGKVSNCATGPRASTAYGQQDCDAVNFLARNPAVRPQIAVGKNDPLVAGAKSILSNPQTFTGNMTGSYSSCSTATVNQPATYDTEVCNQYTSLTNSLCDKLLGVQVTQINAPPNCAPLDNWVNTGLYGDTYTTRYGVGELQYWCDSHTTNTMYFRVRELMFSPGAIAPVGGSGAFNHYAMLVVGTYPPVGSGTVADSGYGAVTVTGCNAQTCTITLYGNVNGQNGSVIIGKPGWTNATNITKSWDNQCTALEALAK